MRFRRGDVRCSTPPIRPPRRPPAPSGWRSLSRSEPTSDAPCRLLGTAASARFRPAARVHASRDAHRNDPRRPGRHTRDPVRGRKLHARSAFHRIAPPQPCDCRWTRRCGFDPASARRAPVRPSFLRPRVNGGRSLFGLGSPRRVSPTVRAEIRATDECRLHVDCEHPRSRAATARLDFRRPCDACRASRRDSRFGDSRASGEGSSPFRRTLA